MESEPRAWQNFSPGDLSFSFPMVASANVHECIARSVAAFPRWAMLSLEERREKLIGCREGLALASESLAALIARETGKPLREARLEMAAVLAKFDLSFADGEKYLRDVPVEDGPNPALIRQRPRGLAAVIAPFNFPVHLGHGAALAYLFAGNTILFKPSPFAVNVGLAYAKIMQEALPADVFQLVPGWGETGRALCTDRAVRSVCFTGSVPVGRELSVALAADAHRAALWLGIDTAGLVPASGLAHGDIVWSIVVDRRAIGWDCGCDTAGAFLGSTSTDMVADRFLRDRVGTCTVARYEACFGATFVTVVVRALVCDGCHVGAMRAMAAA